MSDDLHFVDTHVRMLCMDGIVTEEDIINNDFGIDPILMWPTSYSLDDATIPFSRILSSLQEYNCDLIDANIKMKKRLVDIHIHFRDLDGVGWYGVDHEVWNYFVEDETRRKIFPPIIGTDLDELLESAFMCDEWSDRDNFGNIRFRFNNHSKEIKITDKAKRLFNTTALEDFVKECIEKEKENT